MADFWNPTGQPVADLQEQIKRRRLQRMEPESLQDARRSCGKSVARLKLWRPCWRGQLHDLVLNAAALRTAPVTKPSAWCLSPRNPTFVRHGHVIGLVWLVLTHP